MRKKLIERKLEFLSLRVPKATKEALKKIAEDNERSLSWVVAKILDTYLKDRRSKKL